AAASENFDDVLVHARRNDRISDRGTGISTAGGRHSRSPAEVGFPDVGTFVPFIQELNGFSPTGVPRYTNDDDDDDGDGDGDVHTPTHCMFGAVTTKLESVPGRCNQARNRTQTRRWRRVPAPRQ
ncbi:hypothetical protein X777_12730, partial [Ooceraea biroi]